jgi:heterodisulfide reductase subunit D
MQPIDVSRFTLRQLVEMDGCTRCGECIQWCPTFAEAQRDEITPLDKLTHLRSYIKGQQGWPLARLFGQRPMSPAGLESLSRGAFDCTLCGRCHAVCPVKIRTRDLWIALRQEMVAQGRYPAPLNTLRERVTKGHNISGDDNAQRLTWTENMEHVPAGVARRTEADTVYFVGCVSSLYPAVFGIPQAFSLILERAGVQFTTLGPDEWCCGYPLIIAGMGSEAQWLARHNVEAVRVLGAKRLVVTCPSCYHTWRHDYPRILQRSLGFEVIHASELLGDLIAHGAIRPGALDLQVTYHDPCDLGRNNNVYEIPRRVIRSVPGVSLTEMADTRDRALCCGGGGDAEMANAELSAQVARRRLAQAEATGAKVIVSACQQCKRTLAGAARREKVRIKVMYVTELVWESIQTAE